MKGMKKLSAFQIIVLAYFVSAFLFSFVLYLPVSHNDGMKISYIDALFTSVSALSVTGLTVVNTADTFSTFGIFIIMLLIQFGGIGIMTLGTLLWLFLGQNISLSQRKLIMIDQNRSDLAGLVRLMQIVLLMALLFELVGAVIFTIYFRLAGYFDSWIISLYHGLFHSLASYTNAGFDIFGNSLYDFRHDYVVQLISILLIILGAIGFPVLIEVREKLFGKQKHFRFSLFTKLTTITFFALMIAGFLGILFMEWNIYFADMSFHEKIVHALFNSVTVRSAGLATLDVENFGITTQFLMSMLMFIGASPSSVGGGIRTTTFVVILLTLFYYARGKHEIRVFHRTIAAEDIFKSFVVFSSATIMVGLSIILLDSFESQKLPLVSIIFEVTSAFGTTGLSTGITTELSDPSKMLIMALMFIGRVGILSFFFLFRKRRSHSNVHYPKETILIG